VGLTPDGGRLPAGALEHLETGIRQGLSVVSGLHTWLSEDARLAELARRHHVQLLDIRKSPPRDALHFFSGRIEEVAAMRVAVLGTDSAVGKRTTAWMLVDAFREAGLRASLVGTGQTAWLQGARHSVIMDAIVNDFVTGEIENAVYQAWKEENAQVLVVEGQGSLLNPAYPGGFEILAAARPHAVVLQHAPARRHYDGFPDYPLHPLDMQILAIELVGGAPVVAVTVNHEGLSTEEVEVVCTRITCASGLVAVDPLLHGMERVREVLSFLTDGESTTSLGAPA
jgi:uncharacterized NAD-dependent epimerase/dehydratase family protein